MPVIVLDYWGLPGRSSDLELLKLWRQNQWSVVFLQETPIQVLLLSLVVAVVLVLVMMLVTVKVIVLSVGGDGIDLWIRVGVDVGDGVGDVVVEGVGVAGVEVL